MIDHGACEFRRVALRRRVLEAADGGLRGEIVAALRATPDCHLQRRIVTQLIVVDAVLIAAAEAEHAGCDDLGQLVSDTRRITPVGQCRCQRRDDADLCLSRAQ